MALLAVLAVAVAATGCGKKKQAAEDETASKIASRALRLSTGQDVDVKVDGDKVTFTDGQGGVTVQGGKGTSLPTDFPEDVPVYSEADILRTAARGKDQFSVALQTKDTVATVAGFYKDAMKKKGWEAETGMDLPNRSIQAYEKGNRAVSLMIAADKDGGCVISMTAARKDK
jgi:hypothetical protein